MTAKRRGWLTAFVPHRLELMVSPAWAVRPMPLIRLLGRLEIEHLRHGGQNNGRLYVSYSQFVAGGISRRTIAAAIEAGGRLGLLEVVRSDVISGDLREPNAYRLTYVEGLNGKAPTDEWRTVSKERALAIVAEFRNATGTKSKQSPSSQREAAFPASQMGLSVPFPAVG